MIKFDRGAWGMLFGLFVGVTASEGTIQIIAGMAGLVILIGILFDLIMHYKGVQNARESE